MVQHFARRRLFGGSFGSPLAHYFIGPRNLHGDPKERFVIAAHAVDQVIARQSFGARLDPLLQAGFGVSRRRDVGLDQWLPGRGDKARRGRQTGVKIERAKHRFHARAHVEWLLAHPAEAQAMAKRAQEFVSKYVPPSPP